MKYQVVPVGSPVGMPTVADPNYLRSALAVRLRDTRQGPVVFRFEVLIRSTAELNIEDAIQPWPDGSFQLAHVATLTIPLQKIGAVDVKEKCERLVFTPWHCLEVYRPLGGINRLRKAV